MSDLEFDVAKRRAEPITFRLGGDTLLEPAHDEEPARYGREDHEYVFTPPKSAVMLMPILEPDGDNEGLGLTKATFDWLGTGLSIEDRERVIGRLKDQRDDLDIDTLTEIVSKLSERVAGRPTT